MKARLLTSTAATIAAFAFAASAASAASKWDGGDDQPTSPFECGTGASAASAPMKYDGGQPTNPPDKAGKEIVLVDVPKLIGIGYFNATSKGIHVVGYDANSTPDAREWFVQQAVPNGIAKAMIDSLAKEAGEDAGFAIVTSTFTTPNQARWIAEMAAYAAKCHPKMQWLETVEAQEDNNLSFNQATTLINKHGDKLKGLLGMTSVATPASAEAVTKAGQCGKIAVVGLATPNAMKPYVNAGCVKSVVLWNPIDLGYAATFVMRAAIDGKLKPGATSVDAGKLGKLNVINGSEILLGSPYIFNKDNIGNFDF